MITGGRRPKGSLDSADLEVLERHCDLQVVLEGDGLVIYANPVTLRVLGYTFEDLVGMHIAEVIHPGDLAGAAEGIGDLQTGAWTPILPTAQHHAVTSSWASFTSTLTTSKR